MSEQGDNKVEVIKENKEQTTLKKNKKKNQNNPAVTQSSANLKVC